jgi:hypothetical protein
MKTAAAEHTTHTGFVHISKFKSFLNQKKNKNSRNQNSPAQ